MSFLLSKLLLVDFLEYNYHTAWTQGSSHQLSLENLKADIITILKSPSLFLILDPEFSRALKFQPKCAFPKPSSSMASKFLSPLLFFSRLILATELIPQLQHRETFLGGIALYAETNITGDY
jgi:hypothetical protein